MNLRKLNERLSKVINEISSSTVDSALRHRRQANGAIFVEHVKDALNDYLTTQDASEKDQITARALAKKYNLSYNDSTILEAAKSLGYDVNFLFHSINISNKRKKQ